MRGVCKERLIGLVLGQRAVPSFPFPQMSLKSAVSCEQRPLKNRYEPRQGLLLVRACGYCYWLSQWRIVVCAKLLVCLVAFVCLGALLVLVSIHCAYECTRGVVVLSTHVVVILSRSSSSLLVLVSIHLAYECTRGVVVLSTPRRCNIGHTLLSSLLLVVVRCKRFARLLVVYWGGVAVSGVLWLES